MASKRRIRRKQCTGKVRHASAEAALAHVRALRRVRGYDGLMNTYRCPFCNGYHVGHGGTRHA